MSLADSVSFVVGWAVHVRVLGAGPVLGDSRIHAVAVVDEHFAHVAVLECAES